MKSDLGTRLGLFCAVLLIAACQQFALVESNKPVKIGNAFTVTPTSNWSGLGGTGTLQQWTIDGPRLQQVLFSVEIGEGDPYIPTRVTNAAQDGGAATFDPTGTPLDDVDGFVSNLRTLGFEDITVFGTSVVEVAGRDAVLIDYSAVTKTGPEMLGMAYLFRIGSQLHIATFYGTRLYHFERHRAEFQNMMNSIRWSETV
jgi:hypothetical protein